MACQRALGQKVSRLINLVKARNFSEIKIFTRIRSVVSGRFKTITAVSAGYVAHRLAAPLLPILSWAIGYGVYRYTRKRLDLIYPFPRYERSESVPSITLSVIARLIPINN